MARRLGAIAARGHIAPTPPSVLRSVVEHAIAAHVRAATHARHLTEEQRVGGRFDNRDHQSRECVTDGNESASVCAIVPTLDATRPRAATENTIDLAECIAANLLSGGGARPTLGQHSQRTANATRIDERRSGSGWLLAGTTSHAEPALGVDERRCLEPGHQRLEIA